MPPSQTIGLTLEREVSSVPRMGVSVNLIFLPLQAGQEGL